MSQNGDDKLHPAHVVREFWEHTKGESIVTTGVGQHQMWTAQFFHFTQPRTFLSSGGLGTMGYGLPAALGAQAAFPDRQVIDISGDGSFQMNSQELATLVLLFGFQGETIIAQPLVIVLLAVPILIQVYFNAGLAYGLNRLFGEAHCVAAPSALIQRPSGRWKVCVCSTSAAVGAS